MTGRAILTSPMVARAVSNPQPWWYAQTPLASMAADFTKQRGMINGVQTPIEDFVDNTNSTGGWIKDNSTIWKEIALNTLKLNDRGLGSYVSYSNLIEDSEDFTQWGKSVNLDREVATGVSIPIKDSSDTGFKFTKLTDGGSNSFGKVITNSTTDKRTLDVIVRATSTSDQFAMGIFQGGFGSDSDAEIISGPGFLAGTTSLKIIDGLSETEWTHFSITRNDVLASNITILMYPGAFTGALTGDASVVAMAWCTDTNRSAPYIQTTGSVSNAAADQPAFSDLSWVQSQMLIVVKAIAPKSFTDGGNYFLSGQVGCYALYMNGVSDNLLSFDGGQTHVLGPLVENQPFTAAFAIGPNEDIRSSLNGNPVQTAITRLPTPTQFQVMTDPNGLQQPNLNMELLSAIPYTNSTDMPNSRIQGYAA